MLLLGHIAPVVAVTHWYLSKPAASRKFFKQFTLLSVDWRWVWSAGIMNDLLDKPSALFFFPELGSTRHIFHTLLVNLGITSIIFLFSSKQNRLSSHLPWLAGGMLTHLLLDWIDLAQPKTLFFPLFGWQFERFSSSALQVNDYLQSLISRLYQRPLLPAFEIIGAFLLLPHLAWVKSISPQHTWLQRFAALVKTGSWNNSFKKIDPS